MIASESKNALVLLSGGIDSSACLVFYLAQGFSVSALFVDYGQVSKGREESAVSAICARYGIPFAKITTKGFREWAGGLVPGRNAFLLYVALMAFPRSSGVISIGIHAGTQYCDCSKGFLEQIQTTFDLYTDGRIAIGAPFLDWSKSEILSYCRRLGVPVELTYSCELGEDQPCGKCLSCKDLEKLYVAGEK
jgi:7-cyano-7-deazaguanine synthase